MAIGEVDVIMRYLPAVLSEYILDPIEFVRGNIFLQDKFKADYEINSQFLLLEFEKAFFYSLMCGAVIIPLLVLLSMMFKR